MSIQPTIPIAEPVAETIYTISPVISMVRSALWNTCTNIIFYALGVFLTLGIHAYIPILLVCAPTLCLLLLVNAYISCIKVQSDTNIEIIRYWSKVSKLLWCASFLLIGFTSGPLIGAFILTITNGPMLIAVAALATIVLTISMFAWTYSLKKIPTQDVRFWNPIVINIVFSIAAAILLNVFCGLPMFQVGIAIGGACIFTIVLLADILQLIIHDKVANHNNEYRAFLSIQHGANIALDVIKIFEDILKMMWLAEGERTPNIIVCSIIAVVRFIPMIILGICVICLNQKAFEIMMDEESRQNANDLFTQRPTPSIQPRTYHAQWVQSAPKQAH